MASQRLDSAQREVMFRATSVRPPDGPWTGEFDHRRLPKPRPSDGVRFGVRVGIVWRLGLSLRRLGAVAAVGRHARAPARNGLDALAPTRPARRALPTPTRRELPRVAKTNTTRPGRARPVLGAGGQIDTTHLPPGHRAVRRRSSQCSRVRRSAPRADPHRRRLASRPA
jgi:hypothetical protein